VPAAPRGLRQGGQVVVVVVEDPKGKGRLFVRHEESNQIGHVLNAGEIPQESKVVGQRITLEVFTVSADGRQVAFRWPTAAKK
jgi:hypothetical protein